MSPHPSVLQPMVQSDSIYMGGPINSADFNIYPSQEHSISWWTVRSQDAWIGWQFVRPGLEGCSWEQETEGLLLLMHAANVGTNEPLRVGILFWQRTWEFGEQISRGAHIHGFDCISDCEWRKYMRGSFEWAGECHMVTSAILHICQSCFMLICPQLQPKKVNKNAWQNTTMLYISMLYVLYMSKHAWHTDFSMIGIFVNFLMTGGQCDRVWSDWNPGLCWAQSLRCCSCASEWWRIVGQTHPNGLCSCQGVVVVTSAELWSNYFSLPKVMDSQFDDLHKLCMLPPEVRKWVKRWHKRWEKVTKEAKKSFCDVADVPDVTHAVYQKCLAQLICWMYWT